MREEPYEEIWFRVRLKLVSEGETKLGIAKTTIDTKFRVVGRSAKDFLTNGREIKNGSGHMFYKIDSSSKGIRLKSE